MEDGIVLSAQSMHLPIDAAPHLHERYERLLDAVSRQHSGDICDEAKSFLECVYRTIITNRNGTVDEGRGGRATFMQLHDQAWDTLQTVQNVEVIQSAIRDAAQAIGSMRNEFGAVSHGQDGFDERRAGLQEALFISRQALSIAGYFYSHHLSTGIDSRNARLQYEDNPGFNEYLDAEGNLMVAGIVMMPSEVLFNNDLVAYREQLLSYNEGQQEVNDD